MPPFFSSLFSRTKHSNSGKKMARKRDGLLGWIISLAILGLLALLAAMQVDAGYPKLFAGIDDFRYSKASNQKPDHRQRLLHGLANLKASLDVATPPSSPQVEQGMRGGSRVYHAVDYGADPTGKNDSTSALLRAIDDAFKSPGDRTLMPGIADLGGAELHLDGGSYLISSPIKLPASKGGNFKIHSGSLLASDDFPTERFLIELWASPSSEAEVEAEAEKDVDASMAASNTDYDYEYITIRDLLLKANFRCGGIAVVNSLRTTINNCYITHFKTTGIWVRGGHETYISDSYLGQHITAGNHPDEKNFSGTGIKLMGNDNAVTDVVIFSAETGVLVTGQANILTGVHCYNKATGWGGTGIYLKLPGLTQTRIVNCYLDFNSIVSEDPMQLTVSNCYFLGGGNIVLKSVNGKMSGVNIVDNMFSGGGNGVDIVRLDESNGAFTKIEQVVVHRNNVDGMRLRTTVAKASVQGNGSVWTVDFSPVLLFRDRIEHVQYTLRTGSAFPNHALRNVSENKVVIESDIAVSASVDVSVDQSVGSSISIN
ncbi:hypothetical protein J5N97_017883 [Dioscorea zingiberensis]|uniref:Pectate lyase superfamily protein domain-containing protein n=1 Tax=Dioscorea zingiberensis TaxID=325984 RepID=A0A9D5HGY2_9LILI|nr:hypothetical protein J5N97_017883 [Dioscorea zingiberensis]